MISTAVRARLRPIRADLAITAVAALLFTWALWTSLEWSFSAALFPRMVTATGIAVAVLHLVLLLARSARPETSVSDLEGAPAEDSTKVSGPDYDFAKADRWTWLTNCGWIFAFLAGTYIVGLFFTAPLFTLAYLRFAAATSWRVAVIYAAVVAVVLFGLFDQLLHLPMPLGVIQE